VPSESIKSAGIKEFRGPACYGKDGRNIESSITSPVVTGESGYVRKGCETWKTSHWRTLKIPKVRDNILGYGSTMGYTTYSPLLVEVTVWEGTTPISQSRPRRRSFSKSCVQYTIKAKNPGPKERDVRRALKIAGLPFHVHHTQKTMFHDNLNKYRDLDNNKPNAFLALLLSLSYHYIRQAILPLLSIVVHYLLLMDFTNLI
jgi:hypothetical protein